MLYLYTKNDDGTVSLHCQSDYQGMLSGFADAHNLHDYFFTDIEPVYAQGKYWLDASNPDYLKAHELDVKAREEAQKKAEEEAAKPSMEQKFAELQANFDLMSEALDALIMDDNDSSSSDISNYSIL